MSTAKIEVPTVWVERQFDATVLNAVVNDPSVYPWVKGFTEGPLDLTKIASDPQNVLLSGEFGSMLFAPSGPGLWELHTQVLPEGRGPWTMGLARSAFLYLFAHTDAMEVLTRVPKGNIAAASAAKKFGFSPQWTQADGWVFDGEPCGVTVYGLTLQTWLAGPWSASLEGEAERFSTAISEGDDAPLRADAKRPLGFALAAIRGKQPAKGCALLNRWAAFTGFPAAQVVETNPLSILLGGAVFRVSESGSLVDLATLH